MVIDLKRTSMKYSFPVLVLLASVTAMAQMPNHIRTIFPEGTIFHQNIPYAGDTLKKHTLDVYLPANADPKLPLIVWIHGGAWNHNDKYADMGYMRETVKGFLENGYAFASIDYRHSTTKIFPAQVHDCSQALEFLYNNANKYNIDKSRIALIGFSAGGHLASILGLSLNNQVKDFYPNGKEPSYKIKAVIDFYGPADLLMMSAKQDPADTNDPIYQLLGDAAVKRPDLAKRASPVTYVDKNDPPFFIVNGEKDESAPYQQSILLKSLLDRAGVKNEITIVKDAPHYGPMFDAKDIRVKLFQFLKTHL
jgi:acetyl esterase/lipase